MTKWIVFDAMGVIFEEGDDIRNRLVPFLSRHGSAPGPDFVHSVYRRASVGLISNREFWEIIGLGGEYPAIEREYLDTCLTLDPHCKETIAQLTGRYRLAIFSNDVKEWSAYLQRKFGLDKFFQLAVISSEAKLRKPDPGIYKILLERLQTKAGDCLFIDDRIPNLQPAAALGMETVWLAKGDQNPEGEIRHRIKTLSELPGLVEKIFPAT